MSLGKPLIVTVALSSCSLWSLATTAYAQTPAAEAADSESVIIVTARRREEAFNDVPTVGTVLTNQAIIDQGNLLTMQDLANNLPSVNFANTGTPSTSEISMRGSGTARATNAEGAVGLYRNGTYVGGGRVGGRTFTRMDFFDLYQVEVLRGVQGALYGRNAVGGSLNLINAKPEFKSTGFAIAEAANNERFELQSAVNVPLSDTVAVRIGGDFMEQTAGDFFNTFTNQWRDVQSARGVRGQIRVKKDRLDFNLLAEISDANLPPLVYNLNFGPNRNFPQGIQQDPYAFGWNGRTIARQKQNAIIANLQYDLDVAELSSSVSIRRRKTQHGFDGDGLDPILLGQLRANRGGLRTDPNLERLQEDDTNTFYAEVHLNDPGNSPFRWLIGYEHLDIRSNSLFTETGTPNPSPGIVAPAELDTISHAAYGSLGYDFSDRIGVTGEFRYLTELQTLDANRFDILSGLSVGSRFVINAMNRQDHSSYTLTASYKIPKIGGLLYVKQGTAFRAGGFNTDLGDPRAPNMVPSSFGNEDATAYEVGFKGDILPWLYLQSAIYQTDTANILVQDDNGCGANVEACPVVNTPFLRNGGNGRVRGFEVEAKARFNIFGGRLRLSGAVSHNDADIISGRDAGKKVPQVASWTYNASVNYSHPGPGDSTLFTNFVLFRREGGVQEIIQTPFLENYTNIDGRLGIRFSGLELAVYSRNIVDNRFRINAAPATERFNLPRTFGAELTKRW